MLTEEDDDEEYEALLGIHAELEDVLYADHVRFHSCYPYIERLPTLH